ncbi:MAG: hypothetical protein IPN46_13405 [Saprospiraceae bacterium]|nr:hypothetical protein [Saprospiraceae bacterium]
MHNRILSPLSIVVLHAIAFRLFIDFLGIFLDTIGDRYISDILIIIGNSNNG